MDIYFFTIFFAIFILYPFAYFLYEGNRTAYKGSELLCEIYNVDLNTERILSVLSNRLKKEGYVGIRFALLMLTSFLFYIIYALFKTERIEQFCRSILIVRVHESEFDLSNNGSLKKALDTVKTLKVKNKKLIFNVEKEGEYYVFEMSVWGYIRLRFANVIEKPFYLKRNAHKIYILLAEPGNEVIISSVVFRAIFSIKETVYNQVAGIKRILNNVQNDFQKEGLGKLFDYRFEGDNIVLCTKKEKK